MAPAPAFIVWLQFALCIVGLLHRPSGRVLKRVGWVSLVLLTIYLLNASFLYLYSG